MEIIVAGVVLALIGGQLWLYQLKKRRYQFIATYEFPPRLITTLQKTYPTLSEQQLDLVIQGLRQYFQMCLTSRRRMVSMPSQVVDVAWHELILFTKTYQLFCKRAFGRFLHHIPAEAMSSPTQAQDGIKRAWRLACNHEGIDPKQPVRLPLIFELDALLAIPEGFRYVLDCQKSGADTYCGSHVGCGGGCGGSGGGDSDGGGDGGGCGGGGE